MQKGVFKSIICIFLMIFLVLPLVLSVKLGSEQVAVGDNTLELRLPVGEVLKLKSDVTLHTHVYNKTTGFQITNETAECEVDIYNSSGSEIFRSDMEWDIDEKEFELDIPGLVFNHTGFYSFLIQCNTSSQGGFVSGGFDVTETGEALTEDNLSIAIIFGIVFIVGFYLVFIRFFSLDVLTENAMVKLLFVLLALWMTLIPINIITLFNIANLGPSAITSVLKMLFMIMMWINVFITLYFILWFITQLLKSIGRRKREKEENG